MAYSQYRSARRMADATPDSRNRYVDFLRAAAILAVVLGHWLMAAVWLDGTGFHAHNVLGEIEATQWLTWGLQVMPIFFLVGGFSNAASRAGSTARYGAWLRSRLQRLILPTLPLISLWAAIGFIGPLFGLDRELARLGSQTALVPLWFLAVYVVMVAATPVTTAIWRRYGARAVGGLTMGALTVDGLRAATTVHVGYLNYVLVWGAIYLLGHAWYEGVFATGRRAFMLAILGAVGLVTMTIAGPYHVSMVGVPGVEFGNTAPPSAALLALGFAQIGLALSIQRVMRRLLSHPAAWTTTVLINGSIMTLYVWHMTALALTIGVLKLMESPVLALAPSAGVTWWVSRPLWIGILVLATVPFLAALRGLESATRAIRRHDVSTPVALAAAGAACISFGSVAFFGMTSAHPMAAFLAVAPMVAVARWLTQRDVPAPI